MIEIGVQEGYFADLVLSKWPSFKTYYGIDPWTQQANYKDGANVDNNAHENKYKNTLKKFNSKFGENRIKLIRNFSNLVVSYFKDYSLDFIYIDGRHDYCGVYEDLTLYYPKLKCNGIMGGHDYYSAEEVKKMVGDDYGLCGNGTRVEHKGGAVKGIF